ncbi:SAM-dependent methyltransferase [Streptomyces sp. ODS28]|uniref:SAM-dependent methyltransferase n=1 Tax=Streptomyces sp. ODS28 TaxID=3136688 RepID=UPI0031EBFB95
MRENTANAAAADPGGDPGTPSVARMYDFYLGGTDNYPVDREAVGELDKVVPSTRPLAVNNRRFLRRVVRVLAEEYGVRQFLDQGSGLPTQDNVHQVAQRVDPAARVVYVDNDPAVLERGGMLLRESGAGERTAVIEADMRDTETIFGHPDTRRLLDLDEPVGVLFVSVMHCLPDASADGAGGPAELVERVLEKVPSGSFLVINQLVSDQKETRDFVTGFMDEATHGNWGRVREEHEVARYFEGLEVLEPGLGRINDWRLDAEAAKPLPEPGGEWWEFGGVARKP